jgi:hypothetical protein
VQFDLTSFLGHGPDEALQRLKSQGSEFTTDAHLLAAVGFITGQKACEKADLESALALAWAEVALEAYALLSQSDPPRAGQYALSTMMLRAAMIRRLGPVEGHAVLDQSLLEHGLLSYVREGPAEVRASALNWRGLSVEEIRYLRGIKNRLTALEVALPGIRGWNNPSVCEWIGLRDSLP